MSHGRGGVQRVGVLPCRGACRLAHRACMLSTGPCRDYWQEQLGQWGPVMAGALFGAGAACCGHTVQQQDAVFNLMRAPLCHAMLTGLPPPMMHAATGARLVVLGRRAGAPEGGGGRALPLQLQLARHR